jgi:transcriptional regulator with XRE-family HTH domain
MGPPSPEILRKLAGPLGVPYETLMNAAGYLSSDDHDPYSDLQSIPRDGERLMNGDNVGIGNRLKIIRDRKGLNQKEAAETFGISNVVLNRYENDERTPDVETLGRLAEFYGVTTDYLLGRTNNPTSLFSDNDPNDEIQPTPPERIRTFQKKIASSQLSEESINFLEFQLERLRELDQEAVNRRRAERDAKHDKK